MIDENKNEFLGEDSYEPTIMTLTDEDGTEYAFEVLDEIELEDNRYLALLPQYDDPQDMLESDGELVILKVGVDGDEEYYDEIEDDNEYEEVATIFTDRLQDLFEIDDE
jgi:uncharacterized protein YrzB (UPF0473 family)